MGRHKPNPGANLVLHRVQNVGQTERAITRAELRMQREQHNINSDLFVTSAISMNRALDEAATAQQLRHPRGW